MRSDAEWGEGFVPSYDIIRDIICDIIRDIIRQACYRRAQSSNPLSKLRLLMFCGQADHGGPKLGDLPRGMCV